MGNVYIKVTVLGENEDGTFSTALEFPHGLSLVLVKDLLEAAAKTLEAGGYDDFENITPEDFQ